jgi:hypothetical protein
MTAMRILDPFRVSHCVCLHGTLVYICISICRSCCRSLRLLSSICSLHSSLEYLRSSLPILSPFSPIFSISDVGSVTQSSYSLQMTSFPLSNSSPPILPFLEYSFRTKLAPIYETSFCFNRASSHFIDIPMSPCRLCPPNRIAPEPF